MSRKRSHKRYELENLEPRILLSGDPLVGALASLAPGGPESEESALTSLEEVLASEESNAYSPSSSDSASYDPAASLDDIFSGLTGGDVDEPEEPVGADETYDVNFAIGDRQETQILLGLTELVRLAESVELSEVMASALPGLGDTSLGELIGLVEILDSRLAKPVYDYFGDAVDPPTAEGILQALAESLNTLGDLGIKVSSLEGGFVSADGELRFDVAFTATREGQLLLGDEETGSDQPHPADYVATLEFDISFGVDLDQADGFFLVVRAFKVNLTVSTADSQAGSSISGQPLEARVDVGFDAAAGADGRLTLGELQAITAGNVDLDSETAGSLLDTENANIAPTAITSAIEGSEGGTAERGIVVDKGPTGHSELTLGPTTLIEIRGVTAGTGLNTYDQIVVAGNAELGGTLDIVLNGFTPAPGDIFEVVTYGSSTGAFSDFTGLDLGGGLTLAPVQGPEGLLLITIDLSAVAGLLVTIQNKLDDYINNVVSGDLTIPFGSIELGGFLQLLDLSLTFTGIQDDGSIITGGSVTFTAGSAVFFPGQALFAGVSDGADPEAVAISGTYDIGAGTFSLDVDQLDVMVLGVLSAHAETLTVNYNPAGTFVLDVAQLDVTVAGFVSVSGSFSFQETAGEILAVGDNVTVRMEVTSSVYVELAGAEFGLIASPGQIAFELKNGTLDIHLGDFANITTTTVFVQYTNLATTVAPNTTITAGAIDHTFVAGIASSTIAFAVNGLNVDIGGVFNLNGNLGFSKVGLSPTAEILAVGSNLTVRLEATSSVHVELAGADFGLIAGVGKTIFELNASGTGTSAPALDIHLTDFATATATSVFVRYSAIAPTSTVAANTTISIGPSLSYTFASAIEANTIAVAIGGLDVDIGGVFNLTGSLGFSRVGLIPAEILAVGSNLTVRLEATSSVYVELAGADFGLIAGVGKTIFELNASGTGTSAPALDIHLTDFATATATSVFVRYSAIAPTSTVAANTTISIGPSLSYTFASAIEANTIAVAIGGLDVDIGGVFNLTGSLGFSRVGLIPAEILAVGSNVRVRLEATSSVYVELAGADFGLIAGAGKTIFELNASGPATGPSAPALDIHLSDFVGATATSVFVRYSGPLVTSTVAANTTISIGPSLDYTFASAIVPNTIAVAIGGLDVDIGGVFTLTGSLGFSRTGLVAEILAVGSNVTVRLEATSSVYVELAGADFGLIAGAGKTIFELNASGPATGPSAPALDIHLSDFVGATATSVFVRYSGPLVTSTVAANTTISIGPSLDYTFASAIVPNTIAVAIGGLDVDIGGVFTLTGSLGFSRTGLVAEILAVGSNVTVRLEATSSVYVELAGADFGLIAGAGKTIFELNASGPATGPSAPALDIHLGDFANITATSVFVRYSGPLVTSTVAANTTISIGPSLDYTFASAIVPNTIAVAVGGLNVDIGGVFHLSGSLGFSRTGTIPEILAVGSNVTVRLEATSSVYAELAGADFGLISRAGQLNDPRQSRGLISVSPSKGPVKSRLKAADAPTPCSAPPNAAPPAPAAKCIPARIVCPSPPWKRNSLALRNSSLSNGVSVPESSGQSRLHSSP